jgi:hypothetical protein
MTDRPDPREVVAKAVVEYIINDASKAANAAVAALTASGYAIVPAAEGEVGELAKRLRYGPLTVSKSTGDILELAQAASHLERLAAENERLKEAEEMQRELKEHARRECDKARARAERAEAENERLKAAAKAVEDWWLSDGMRIMEAAGEVGAPYAIFATRATLTQEDKP